MKSEGEIAELSQRIRAAARRQNQPPGPATNGNSVSAAAAVPDPVPSLPAASAARTNNDPSSSAVLLDDAKHMLLRARKKNSVSPGIPSVLRPLFRNQGGVNGIVLEALTRLLEINQQLRDQNIEMQERLMTMHGWMNTVTQHAAKVREWMIRAEPVLGSFNESSAVADARLSSIEDNSARAGEHLGNLQRQTDAIERHGSHLGEHLKNLQAHTDRQSAHVDAQLDAALTEFRQAQARHSLLEENARRMEERHAVDSAFIKSQLLFQQRVLQQALSPAAAGQDQTAGEAGASAARQEAADTLAEHDLDALYVAFEDAFRGSRSDIRQNLTVYLPYVERAQVGTPAKPLLDLGCGRGEWLDLLREHGYTASGVDLNAAMIQQCHDRGLDARLADALSHLRSLPGASCGAVTAFHLIEHLPFRVLVEFLRQCRRVLQPGGLAIFETPNPYNVAVGSGRFYHDFTHERPLPPKSTQFIVEQFGFTRVDVLPLHPCDDVNKVPVEGSPILAERFNELFYGPQDYAILAVV